MNKNELRLFYKNTRKNISASEKANYNLRIFVQLINSKLFSNAETILTYVSFGSEVDTEMIIDYALKMGKTVAVPYCSGSQMLFFQINSFSDLQKGKFGIPTVFNINGLEIKDFNNALCLVPGLSFDLKGNRLGYGGGYYDRYIAKHGKTSNFQTVSLALSCQFYDGVIPMEEHDIRPDFIYYPVAK